MNLQDAYHYCLMNGRNKDMEQYIMKDPEYAYYYIIDIINNKSNKRIRWMEAIQLAE